MRKLLLFICFTFICASDINNQLLDFLYDETGWVLDENLDDNSKIYVKDNKYASLQAVKISRIIDIEPNKILNIIKESLSKSVEDNFSVTDTLSIPLREARESFEKEYLVSQLKKFGGNISKTAKFVGMERSALHRKLKILGVKDLN